MAINFPSNPSNGDTHAGFTWNATTGAWQSAAYHTATGNTAPTNPQSGDQWFDTSDGTLYVYFNDGSSSQWVGVSGPQGPQGPSGASGVDGSSVTSYANTSSFPSSNNTVGDFAFATDTKTLYTWDGTEWDRIAHGNDESPVIITEPPTTSDLNNDGTTSTITMVAQDPEGFDINYGIAYKTTGNSLPNQLASATTVNANGEFTFTPSSNTSNAGSFRARLSASDGARTTTRFVDFSLAFLPVVEYLIVAGGGGGGGWAGGGGGGGGGVLTGTYTATSQNPGAFTVTVGDGGAGNSGQGSGSKGQNSSVFGLTAEGGGYGSYSNVGGSGGSGGGGGGSGTRAGGQGTAGQGNDGGSSFNTNTGGGGGGAGAAGTSATSESSPGNGGDGIQSSITGTATYYGGGGGGGRHMTAGAGGSAGLGGGGAGGSNSCNSSGNGVAGTPNTGGGGGGAGGVTNSCGMASGAGGSGVVILRTKSPVLSTTGSPTITTDGDYSIYTFTQTGSITF
jgi:hypothetical protein